MDRLKKVLVKVLKVRSRDITDAMSPQSVPTWDSFNGILLADTLEKEFRVRFTLDEMMDVENVADIKRHLRNHGITI